MEKHYCTNQKKKLKIEDEPAVYLPKTTEVLKAAKKYLEEAKKIIGETDEVKHFEGLLKTDESLYLMSLKLYNQRFMFAIAIMAYNKFKVNDDEPIKGDIPNNQIIEDQRRLERQICIEQTEIRNKKMLKKLF